MPERTSYEPGIPSWVDLSSHKPDASVRFYGELFGWRTAKPGPDDDKDGYRMFTLRDKIVAGLGPLPEDGQPPVWATYIAVADADETAAKVIEAGGHTLMPPLDVLDAGRTAVFADTEGAVFCIWQANEHPGAELVNEPGTWCWNELATREPEKAKAFYGAVFGWSSKEYDTGGGMPYTEWLVGDATAGGMMEMGDMYPEDVPPHWMVYFAVEDADATTEKAISLGGSAVVEPRDIMPGRFAVLGDHNGSVFAILQPKGA